jgi:predicted RNase H-like HicB family nuclease
MTTTYTAKYRLENGAWLVELVDEPRVHTFGRTVAAARDAIRDATALWFDVDPRAFDLVEDFSLPGGAVDDQVRAALKARDEAAVADRIASDKTRAVAGRLVDSGVSMRDVGSILGISHQRVHQLVHVLNPFDGPTNANGELTGSPT